MKKIIKSKLFFGKGCFKNLFLWEVVSEHDTQYQLVEHMRDDHQSKEIHLGWYKKRLQAFSEFKKAIRREVKGLPYDRVAFE